MRKGQSISIIQDNEDPLKSTNTNAVAAWLSFGGALVKSGGYQHAMDGQSRFVQWLIDDSVRVIIDDVECSFETFRGRFMDIHWCKEHPDSQISLARALSDNIKDLFKFAKMIGTGVMKRDANGHGIVYPHSPEWLKEEFQRRFL
jgi:hypothetical protein